MATGRLDAPSYNKNLKGRNTLYNMSKERQVTNLSSGDGGTPYCRACQKSFVNTGALHMHYRDSKAHREKIPVPSPSASGTGKPKVPSTNKEPMCNICNRQFINKAALRKHEKDSQKHRTLPKATRSISSSIAKAPASSLNCKKEEIVAAPEAEAGRAFANENDNIDEPLTDSMDQPCPLPLSRLGLHATQTSFLKGDPDANIGLTGALVVQHTPYEISVGHGVLPFSKTDPDEAKADNPVASVSVEHQKKNTNFGNYGFVVPGVPPPWSPIPSSERDVVLNALQTQCHPIECLVGEGYWTQTPSPVDIDMTIKCSVCGVAKRRISTDPADSVCRFHPARKPFQQGSIRARGIGVPKTARCVNCKQFGRSKGCIVLSAHDFAAPDAKLSNMEPTPAYNRGARKAVVLDCEMVGVLGAGGRQCSEVVRVSAVDFLSREVIIDTYVSPQGHVISWRTMFSGVNSSVLAEKKRAGKLIKGWRAARDLLWHFIDAQTVLIGHSLHHDLTALGMVHTRVVDSAIITRVAVGEDCQRRWALKTLCQQFLDRDIQARNDGHDCVEDTYAAREVILWSLRNSSKLQAWAADERRIIAEKHKKKEVLITKATDIASTN